MIKNFAACLGICIVFGVAHSFAQTVSYQIVPGVKAGAITARTSEAQLIKIYGSKNVERGEIGIGEGETVPGTIIFPKDPQRRLEITWKDDKVRNKPDYVQFFGKKSRWRLASGIGLGTTLKTIEQLNGGAFKLYGFGWDYSGTVTSLGGGKLARSFGKDNRYVTLRLHPSRLTRALEKDYTAVIGDGEFSSKHRSMQKLNPDVYMIIVNFR